jgi:hypothetical protein
VLGSVLPSVSDEQVTVDVGNAERGIAMRNIRIAEAPVGFRLREQAVRAVRSEYIDRAGTKIRCVQQSPLGST